MLHVPGVSLNDKLRLAASKGQTSKVLELLELGATCDADREGRTALHFAAHYGYPDSVTALILNGCDVNTPDFSGHTALQRASAEGHVEIVKELVKHGALVDHQDDIHGNTALHEAAWKGYSETIEVLCKSKANAYIKNKGGFAPLHLACQNGHNQSCRILLLSGCKPDIKNNYGDTPLHTSARYGHAGVIRILISANCDVSEQNKNDDTALHIASAMGRRKLTRILLEAGCKQSLKNKQGETAKDIARRKGFGEVEAILRNPPPLWKVSAQQRFEQSSRKTAHKKRDKDSGTSKDSKDSGSRHKSKNKKSKHIHGNKAHLKRDGKSSKELGNWSPYGCHYSPNISSSFPTTNLDSLPKEPLKKGEQYYLDLAGNIRKGPIGVGYACYCVPFFQHVEQKMENDKQELIEHIDLAHDDLNAKISNLERRTRVQLFNINQGMKECLAADKAECLEKAERISQKERFEMERVRDQKSEELKTELKSWVRIQMKESRDETQHDIGEGDEHSEDEAKDSEDSDDAEEFRRHFSPKSAHFLEEDFLRSAHHSRRSYHGKTCKEFMSRSKSEEVISERNFQDDNVPTLRVLSYRERDYGRSHEERLCESLYHSEQDKENDGSSASNTFGCNQSNKIRLDVKNRAPSATTPVHAAQGPKTAPHPQIVLSRGEQVNQEIRPCKSNDGALHQTPLNDSKPALLSPLYRYTPTPPPPQHQNQSTVRLNDGTHEIICTRPSSCSGSRVDQHDGELHDSQDRDSGYTTKLHSSFESQSSALNGALPAAPHQILLQRAMNQQRLQQLAAEFGDPNEPEFVTMNRQFLDTISHETDKWYERRLQSIERRTATTIPTGPGSDSQCRPAVVHQCTNELAQPVELTTRARAGCMPLALQQMTRTAASPPMSSTSLEARTNERHIGSRNTSSLV